MSVPTSRELTSEPSALLPPARLEFLDGIRGLAALSVVLFHAFLFTGLSGESARELPLVEWIVGYGYLGVPVFIVLSGYVLMLPLTRRTNYDHKSGVATFFKRRVRRILPPYFAALFASGALIAVVPILHSAQGTAWQGKVPVTIPGAVSHLFLLQDLSPDWINQINGPLWSIAVEWQIYFLMPLLLLPLWRRINPALTVSGVVILTTALGVLGVASWAHPWLIGLFCAGMFAAQVSVGRTSIPFLKAFAISSAVAAVMLLLMFKPLLQSRVWITEILVGIVFSIGLAYMGWRNHQGARFLGQSLLESKVLMRLGLVSYSVYLMHSPLLALGNLLTLHLDWTPLGRYIFMTFGVAPIAIAVCAGFYYLVERHFKNRRQAAASASLHSRSRL